MIKIEVAYFVCAILVCMQLLVACEEPVYWNSEEEEVSIGATTELKLHDEQQAENLRQMGLKEVFEGNYSEAIMLYSRAIQIDGLNPVVYLNRGTAYFKIKNNQLAIRDFLKAIEFYPKFAAAYNNLGRAYEEEKQFEKALESYHKAIEYGSEIPTTYVNRGSVFAKTGMYENALSDYNVAVSLDPEYAKAYDAKARMFATAAKSSVCNGADAVKFSEKAISFDPDNLIYLATFAAALAENDQFEEAIRMQKNLIATVKYRDDVFYIDNLVEFEKIQIKNLKLYESGKSLCGKGQK